MSASAAQPVLVVEDNPADYFILQRGFEKAGLKAPLLHCQDAVQALDYLRGEGVHAELPLPRLIMLDLNLPGMNGIEMLAAVKADPHLASIPVVMFSTSSAESDILASYAYGASSYIIKPFSASELAAVLRHLVDYWFTTVALIPAERRARPAAVIAGGRGAKDGADGGT